MAMNPSYNSFLVTYLALLFLILSSHFIHIDASHKKHHHHHPPSSEDSSPPPPSSEDSSPPPPSSEYTSPPPPSSEDSSPPPPPPSSEDTSPPPPSSDPNPSPPGSSTTFDVTKYQHAGNYWTDAFQSAWTAACNTVGGATVLVPGGKTFLVQPTVFDGQSCKGPITFQVEGTIAAPQAINEWNGENNNWLNFNKADKLQIVGGGTIDGQARSWWAAKLSQKPTMVRIGSSDGAMVTGINLVNSPQAHLKFDLCTNAKASGITITSPEDSPNTDGIHVGRSTNVVLQNMVIACGDDCISIGTDSYKVTINNVTCDPSHGISIGSLGKNGEVACVSDITVRDCIVKRSANGGRIKSFPGGRGTVQRVMFSNLQLEDVKVGFTIDQFYGSNPGTTGSDVFVQDITLEAISGTCSQNSLSLMCGQNKPCSQVKISGVNLQSTSGGSAAVDCQYVTGTISGQNSGVENCLGSKTSADWWNYRYNSYVEAAGDTCA